MSLRWLLGIACASRALLAQPEIPQQKSYFDVVRESFPIAPRVKRLVRAEIQLPNINGYQVLTGDFHVHTFYSGGSVLPAERIYEAWSDGLDVMAITDHTEMIGTAMPADRGRAYEQVKDLAASLGLILIHGAEVSTVYSAENEMMSQVTARTNDDFIVLFVKDEMALFAPFDIAMDRARMQGCVNIWAHPGTDWHPIPDKYFRSGWLHGVEIRNTIGAGGAGTDEVEHRFLYAHAFEWAKEKGLAMIASSDAHAAMKFERDPNQQRDLTLLLVKERTAEGVRDAIVSHRTMAWFDNSLWGSQENLSALAAASLDFKEMRIGDALRGIRIYNASSFPFEVQFPEGQAGWHLPRTRIILPPHTASAYPATFSGKTAEVQLRLTNLFVERDKNVELKKLVVKN